MGNEIESRPEILIKDGYVSMAWNDGGDVVDLAEYANDLDLNKGVGDVRGIPSVMLVNIGRGPALDLVVDWRFEDNGAGLGVLSEVQCGESVYQDKSIDISVLADGVPIANYSVSQILR